VVNPVLKAIKNRRSSVRFKSTPLDDEKLDIVLEAGQWAPSWMNSQPWRFIIVKDERIMERMSRAVSTIFSLGIKDAPVCIVVCVNPKEDSFHYIEAGTTATQNMALAAQSLGLSTSWIGVFSLRNEKNSSERKLKEILQIPKEWRLISILPIGVPRFKEAKTRKNLHEISDLNHFVVRKEQTSELKPKEQPQLDTHKMREPSSARDIERALV
jgi:nitroreductase